MQNWTLNATRWNKNALSCASRETSEAIGEKDTEEVLNARGQHY